MIFKVKYQENYSRMELLLRTILGFFYIILPHMLVLMLVGIWSAILGFLAFWIILFTGRYPQSWFEFQVGVMKWQTRLNLRMFNLADGYPSFGINGADENLDLQIEYPEKLSRGHLLLKTMFGIIYVGIPHGFLLFFRLIWTQILLFVAWWVVLFTGRFPQSWFEFVVGTLRWSMRVNLYLTNMSDTFPPFTGKEDNQLALS